jgi:hypothetical protein
MMNMISSWRDILRQSLEGYAEGNIFWGLSNPIVRQVAQLWHEYPFEEVENLLHDLVHECWLTALLVWVKQYPKATNESQKAIFEGYFKHLNYIRAC